MLLASTSFDYQLRIHIELAGSPVSPCQQLPGDDVNVSGAGKMAN